VTTIGVAGGGAAAGFFGAGFFLGAAFFATGFLVVLVALTGFFGAGYFSGFGAVTAEIYPTSIRATAQGFSYNLGRVVSAAAPWTVGALAQTHGFGAAFSTVPAAEPSAPMKSWNPTELWQRASELPQITNSITQCAVFIIFCCIFR
jgi:MFS family permease